MAIEKMPGNDDPPVPAGPDSPDRMRDANQNARRERLRGLTLESAIREFEKLCREVHELHDGSAERRSHPVGLIKFTRKS